MWPLMITIITIMIMIMIRIIIITRKRFDELIDFDTTSLVVNLFFIDLK